ncbi:hypothetical protein IMZ48_42905 [Candidatus Bathyarchaeota archaeon]|nr:hypothetical protein [Candidatus Bathyarchaeota archaeon]
MALQTLLNLGVDPDSEGGPAGTGLMVACEQGHLQSVKILVLAGARISYHGNHGEVSAVTVAGTF